MKDTHKIAIAAAIIIGFVFAFYNNVFAPYGYPAPTLTTGPTPGPGPGPTPTPTGVAGTYTMKDVAYDALDISTALTLGTNVDQYFYAYRNGGWVLLGGHGSSGTDIEVIDADGGYIYIVAKPHTTQAYIVDAAMTIAMNSRCISAQFIDVTGDLVKEFVIKYNMANIPKAASGYPSSTFTGYYLAEDSGSATDGAPSNVAVGASLATNYLEWYISLSAAKKALAYWKVEIRLNTTDPSVAKVASLNVPGIGNLGTSSLVYWKDSTYSYYEYHIGTGTLGDCAFLKVPASQSTKFYFTTGITTDLASSIITALITIYELDQAGNTVTDTDDVNLTVS